MFTLEFNIAPSSKKISINDSIFMMGSCFSDEMGALMRQNKFDCLSNPFGTIYNPYSIFKLLEAESQTENTIESQGIFYHWDAHGTISGLNQKGVESIFESRQDQTQQSLKSANWLIITLGTSFVYEHINAGIVANCHKVMASSFKKRLLNQEEITSHFERLYSYLSELNPKLNIIFTVSPVRHIRDGLIENNHSKAVLIDAIQRIIHKYQDISYFPSYEILIDQLRDYRYYDSDMIHPSKEAIQYIWETFAHTYFDTETQEVLKQWSKLNSAINHKPFQPQSDSHQKFLKSTLEKMEKLNEKLDLSVELKQLKEQIK